MKTLTTVLAAALAIGLAAPIAAQRGPGADPAARWAQLDVNGDGAIDRAEAAARPKLAERFDRLDRDASGRIERQEAQEAFRLAATMRDARQAQRRAMRARFAWLDRDGDGALTLAELGDDAPRLSERFVAIDTNRDGKLVADEMRAFAKVQREQRIQQRG